MTEGWKQLEGQVVNGEFQLRQYLGGCENRAVFLAEHGGREPQKAAIKLISALSETAELQLSLWGLAAKLSHPHLIRLFESGRCQLGNMGLLYVVMEYAEENLAQVLPHRPLTLAEAREMLEPILDALTYVHGQRFVHGHIKPENIMHVEDQLKISSDGLCRIDESRGCLGKVGTYDAPELTGGEISPVADVWSLGITLVEALTQRLPVWEGSNRREPVLPKALPYPFIELVRHCLQDSPQRRWTVAEIVAGMRHTAPARESETSATPQVAFAKRRYLLPAVVLVLLAAVLAVPKLFNRHPQAAQAPPTQVEQRTVQQEPARQPATPEAKRSMQKTSGRQQREVIEKVLPEVPQKARDSIRGTVRVSVRVLVDSSGSVVNAKLDSAGPSKYFADLALRAAQRWKFRPMKIDDGNVSSEWIILRFEFMNSATRVGVQAAP